MTDKPKNEKNALEGEEEEASGQSNEATDLNPSDGDDSGSEESESVLGLDADSEESDTESNSEELDADSEEEVFEELGAETGFGVSFEDDDSEETEPEEEVPDHEEETPDEGDIDQSDDTEVLTVLDTDEESEPVRFEMADGLEGLSSSFDENNEQKIEEEIERWNPVALTKANKKLARWAAKWGLREDPYVQGLQKAISESRNMTTWASLDPFERLPYADSKRGILLEKISEGLAFTRNVLVFIPVAITWWAIGKTTEQFGAYNETRPGEKVNFLDFWENGYGYLDDIKLFKVMGVKIHEIATVDFAIIAGIVALTFTSSLLGVWADRRSGLDEKKALFEREDLALTLVEALEAKRSASPESIAGSIADVLNDLVDASREVRGAAFQLAEASQAVGGFNDGLDQLNVRIEYLSQQVEQRVTAGVVQAISNLGETVNSLNSAVANDTTKIMGEVMGGLEEVGEQLKKSGLTIEFSALNLRETIDDIWGKGGNPPQRRP
jgi:hypothetical protein